MAKLKETTLDFGFVQVPVSYHTAAKDDDLDLKSLCHGRPPKMTIRCQEGGEEFTSWNKVPERGFEWSTGEYIILSPEEIAVAKEKRAKVEGIKVEKAVDLLQVGEKYLFNKGYYLMPPEKGTTTTLGTYRTIYEVIRDSGRAILVRFMPRDKVRHYAITAGADGVLLAHEIVERKPLPYPVPTASPDPKVKAQGKMLIEGIMDPDPSLPPEPDPLFDLIQEKLARMGSLEGVGQTAIVPE